MSEMFIGLFVQGDALATGIGDVFDLRPEAQAANGYAEMNFYAPAPGNGGFDLRYTQGSDPSYEWYRFYKFTEVEHTAVNQWWCKVEVLSTISGFQPIYWDNGGSIGAWIDLWNDWELFFHDLVLNGIPEEKEIRLSIAPDDGGGSPDTGSVKVFEMTWKAYKGNKDYLIQDEFTGLSGDLENHTPDTDRRQQGAGDTPQWLDLFYAESDFDHNYIVLAGNNAEVFDAAQTFTDALYVIDAQVTDFQLGVDFDFKNATVAGGIVGRVQDSSNFWLLAIKNPSATDPVLGLYKVASGVHTLEASKTLTGLGPLDGFGNWVAYRLTFEGNDIMGEVDITESYGAAYEPLVVTLTDSTYNTETRAGLWGEDVAAEWRRFSMYEWPVGFDPIVWDTSPVTSSIIDTGSVSNNIYFYEGANGKTAHPYHSSCGYSINASTFGYLDVIDWKLTSFGTGVFLVKWEPVSGDTADVQINYTTGQSGVWYELFRQDIRLDAAILESKSAVINVTVAVDNGAGSPLPGYSVTKQVTFVSQSTGT